MLFLTFLNQRSELIRSDFLSACMQFISFYSGLLAVSFYLLQVSFRFVLGFIACRYKLTGIPRQKLCTGKIVTKVT